MTTNDRVILVLWALIELSVALFFLGTILRWCWLIYKSHQAVKRFEKLSRERPKDALAEAMVEYGVKPRNQA